VPQHPQRGFGSPPGDRAGDQRAPSSSGTALAPSYPTTDPGKEAPDEYPPA
jgi:hypothetical protein